jgi:hypothetical protein
MRKLLATAAGVAFLGLACSNPCDKLAKEVCAKAGDKKACDVYKERMKAAGAKASKEKCEAMLGNIDREVQRAKRWATGGEKPPVPPSAPPAPTAPAMAPPAAPSAAPAPAK